MITWGDEMLNRLLQLVLAYAVIAFILPVPANATSWEDQLDESWQLGFEEGYSLGWADAECAIEHGDNGYSPNNSYTPDELDESYDEGYKSGHNVGYAKGVEDGVTQAEETPTHWIVYAFAAAVLYGVLKFGIYIGEERNDKTIGELHAENMELHRILNKQDEAVYIIELIAQRNNLTMENMADIFYINYYKCMGYSDSDARALLDQEKQKRIQTKS